MIVSLAWTLAFWLGCVAVPLACVLAKAGGARWLDPQILAIAWATVAQAGVSVAISAAIGLPLGLAAGRRLDTLLVLPSAVPTVVAATAWVAWLGRSGPLAGLGLGYSLAAVVVAHVFFNAPWIALLVSRARRELEPGPREAAATLGAGAWARFAWVIWPGVRWAFASACAQAFAYCAMSFALVLVLGGGPPVDTLETELYSRVRFGALDLGGAAVCAVWQMAVTLAPWALVAGLRARAERRGVVRVPRARGGADEGGLAWGALAVSLLLLVPYVAVFGPELISWGDPGFVLGVARPLLLSLGMSAVTAFATLLTAIMAVMALEAVPGARARAVVQALLALPAGLSALVLGLGFWLAYGRWLDPLSGNFLAAVAVQATGFFPVAFRMLWPVAQSFQRAPMEAAATLGASPWQAFRWVEWPRWRGPVAAALALVAGGALGEVAAVSLFYGEGEVPLPLLVSRLMGQYRFGEARAVSALLLVASLGTAAWVSSKGEVRRVA